MGRFKGYFDDIKIVVYIRRQDYFFESLYARFVKQKPERSSLYLGEYVEFPSVKKREDREKILQKHDRSNREVTRKYLNREGGVLFKEPIKDFPNCPETWKGLTPLDVLDYALPVSGKMSVEISKLRYDMAELEHINSRLRDKYS